MQRFQAAGQPIQWMPEEKINNKRHKDNSGAHLGVSAEHKVSSEKSAGTSVLHARSEKGFCDQVHKGSCIVELFFTWLFATGSQFIRRVKCYICNAVWHTIGMCCHYDFEENRSNDCQVALYPDSKHNATLCYHKPVKQSLCWLDHKTLSPTSVLY